MLDVTAAGAALAKGEAERTAAKGEAEDEKAEKEVWGFFGGSCALGRGTEFGFDGG